MRILSFAVKLKDHHFDLFRVVEATEKFVRCESDKSGIVTFDKSEIEVGKTLTYPPGLEIVEITTDEKIIQSTGRGAIYEQLEAKAKIAHGDYVPNWDDNSYKYFPVFDMRNGGFAYSRTLFTRTFSDTLVGSRLCFPTSTAAENFGKDNLELYRILYKG